MKPEAQDNYSRSQGVAMLSLIQNTTHRQPPHASRVRPEAAGSAFRGHDSHVFKGIQINKLYFNFGISIYQLILYISYNNYF